MKRELKEIKRAPQQLEVARCRNRRYIHGAVVRETSSSGSRTAPKAQPVGHSVVVSFSRCSRQRSRSSGLEASGLCGIEPKYSRDTHPSAGGRQTQPRRSSTELEAGGLPSGDHLPPAPNPATRVPCPSLRPSKVIDQPAADRSSSDVATQRYKAIEMPCGTEIGKCASHLELLPDAKRLLTGGDEQEFISRELRHEVRLRKFLDEGHAPRWKGSDSMGKGEEKGKLSDKEKVRQGLLLREVGSQTVGGGPGAC